MSSSFILAITTSSGVARVAAMSCVQQQNLAFQVVFNFEIAEYKSQSVQLLPKIRQHLEQSALQAEQCQAIAVDVGPGGFTSLRTACGVAQGLATAWQVPVIPLSSFECMLPAQADAVEGREYTVLIDARLNEVYMATLSRNARGTVWVEPPRLLSIELLGTVRGDLICDESTGALLSHENRAHEIRSACPLCLAQLACQELEAGRVSDPFACQPVYVRDKVAQTTRERLASKHGHV